MAAVAKLVDKTPTETNVANSIAESWSINFQRFTTNIDQRSREQLSPLTSKQSEYVTELVLNQPTAFIEVTPKPATAMSFPAPTGIRRINGVIAEIKQDSVVIDCDLPSGGRVEMNLPPALIPSDLQKFGTPVQISLDSTSGVRIPLIERRVITEQPKLAGQKEVEDWIEKL